MVLLTTDAPPCAVSRLAVVWVLKPAMIKTFTRLFGTYPFDSYSVVVTDALEIPGA